MAHSFPTRRSSDLEAGWLDSVFTQTETNTELRTKLVDKLNDFSVRLVLTAHPTQFYPGPVLAIMTDLIEALKKNDIHNIHLLLQQLGKDRKSTRLNSSH